MEHDILQFLSELSAVQEQTLSVLNRKQKLLVKPNHDALAEIAVEEQEVLIRLRECLDRREEILDAARQQGHDVESLQSLCRRILSSECLRLVEEAARRSRLIQSQSMTNWMMTQKSIIHLSYLLEMIATNGRGKPTYHRPNEKESSVFGGGGGFVDRVA